MPFGLKHCERNTASYTGYKDKGNGVQFWIAESSRQRVLTVYSCKSLVRNGGTDPVVQVEEL